MVILSVDYGDARTGIAACDALQMLASPVTVIHQTEKEPLADEICRIAAEKKAQKLVLGLPKNMDGSEGESAKRSVKFRDELKKYLDINIVLWDERKTTSIATTYLNITNTRGKKRKNIIDTVSATIILEDYIKFKKSLDNNK